MDRRKDENLTRKTCSKKIQTLQVTKMENLDEGFYMKHLINMNILLIGDTEWKAK